MSTRYVLTPVSLLSLVVAAGCGPDAGAEEDASQAGAASGTAGALDPDAGPSPDVGSVADASTGAGNGRGQRPDATAPGEIDASDGSPDYKIRTAEVACGDEPCSIRDGLSCCDPWKDGAGYEQPMCIKQSACQTPFALAPPAKELARSECDGPEDCPTGPAGNPFVCCFVLQGAPRNLPLRVLYSFDDAGQQMYEKDALDAIREHGPGLGRECMLASDCFGASTEFTSGAPVRSLSCHDDGDCSHACPQDDEDCTAFGPSWSCHDESAKDVGGGDTPRPHVKICK